MKKIFQQFLSDVVRMLAEAIQQQADKTKFKVIEQKTIDELLRVFHHTIVKKDCKTTIVYESSCTGYSVLIERGDKTFLKLDGLRDIRAVCEASLDALMDKALEIEENV